MAKYHYADIWETGEVDWDEGDWDDDGDDPDAVANALSAARDSGDIGDIAKAALAGVYAEIYGEDTAVNEKIRARGTAGRAFGIGAREGFRIAMRLIGIKAAICAKGCGREVDGDGYLYTPERTSFMAGGVNGCRHESRAWADMKARLDDGTG